MQFQQGGVTGHQLLGTIGAIGPLTDPSTQVLLQGEHDLIQAEHRLPHSFTVSRLQRAMRQNDLAVAPINQRQHCRPTDGLKQSDLILHPNGASTTAE